jgi:hypothetical protein
MHLEHCFSNRLTFLYINPHLYDLILRLKLLEREWGTENENDEGRKGKESLTHNVKR